MGMAEKIRIALVKCGNISEAKLAGRLETSPQNLFKKMKRDNFSVEDLQKIADVLNCKLKITFIMNDTGEEI